MFKKTPLTERINLQFRAEFFNLFNRVQFAAPGLTQGNPSFGVISSQTNSPRLIQFALRRLLNLRCDANLFKASSPRPPYQPGKRVTPHGEARCSTSTCIRGVRTVLKSITWTGLGSGRLCFC